MLQCSIAALVLGDLLGRVTGERLVSDGAAGLAGLLMAWTGLLGAALAARDGAHLKAGLVDAALTPPGRRTAEQLGDAAAAVVIGALAASGLQEVARGGLDVLEGVTTPDWAAPSLNLLARALPGELVGPGTAHPMIAAWEATAPTGALAFRTTEAGAPLPWWAALAPAVACLTATSFHFARRAWRAGAPAAPHGDAWALLALAPTVIGAAWGNTGAMFGLALSLTLIGAPLVASAGLVAAASWISLTGAADGVLRDAFDATKKADLLSIPLFVFAGELMSRGAIAGHFVSIARALTGRLPGGLAIAGVLACAGFAAISGSSPVTLIAVGSVVVPMLRDAGYPDRYTLGLVSAGGTLGILIPPSIPMVLYASVVAGLPGVGAVPTTALFAGGILPGLLITAMLATHAALTQPRRAPSVDASVELTELLRRSMPAWALPPVLLAGLTGIGPVAWTVTEAAAVAVAWALVVELGSGKIAWRDLPGLAADAARSQGALFLLLVLAMSANEAATYAGIPERVAAAVLGVVSGPTTFLLASMALLLVAGCFLDVLSAILVLAPILAPVAGRFGVDPVHFGVLVVMNLEIGYLTPPMGLNLFAAAARFDRPVSEISRAVLPFLAILLAALTIVASVPALTLR